MRPRSFFINTIGGALIATSVPPTIVIQVCIRQGLGIVDAVS